MRYWKPKTIPGFPQVGIAVASYLNDDAIRREASLNCLVNSLSAQTYRQWRAVVVHDGPYIDREWPLKRPDDPRVTYIDTPTRVQQFGHPHRQMAIERLLDAGVEWIGLTNDDNYYVPVYLEWMLHSAITAKAEFVYCDAVHSHKLWKPLPGALRRGHIDLGGFLAHRNLVKKIKFDKFTFAGDWDYINRLRSAAKRTTKVAATLFVHN